MTNLRIVANDVNGKRVDITLPVKDWIADWHGECLSVPENDAVLIVAELDGKSVLSNDVKTFGDLVEHYMETEKTYSLRINFLWDDGVVADLWEFKLIVPKMVTIEKIEEVLVEEHRFLDFDDEEDLYGNAGRSPATLLDYICEKYGWKCENFEYDIDLELQ